MTALAKNLTDQLLTLEDEEKLAVISRLAIQKGWRELHDLVEDLISEIGADGVENGTVETIGETELLESIRQPVL